MNDIDWSNVTSGVGLAGFSTRIGRYLRVLNPILFDFIVPAVTTGPTSVFRRAADGLEWAKPILTAIWVIFQPFFRPPGRLRDVRWSRPLASTNPGPFGPLKPSPPLRARLARPPRVSLMALPSWVLTIGKPFLALVPMQGVVGTVDTIVS